MSTEEIIKAWKSEQASKLEGGLSNPVGSIELSDAVLGLNDDDLFAVSLLCSCTRQSCLPPVFGVVLVG